MRLYDGRWPRSGGRGCAPSGQPQRRNVGCCCSTQGNLFDTAPIEGFIPLPMRRAVIRTHVGNKRVRRLIMPHDRNIPIAVARVWLTEARLLSRRLTPG
jgi:hypothetical protein